MKALGSRLGLRVGSLAMKFALTIVVARTLGFDAVAAYGFAVAASVVASKVLGLGFSTELNRRLSGDAPADAIRTAARLFVLYGFVYAALCAPLAVPGWAAGMLHVATLPNLPLALVALIACAEHAALEVNTYLFSLHRARAASWLLFVRTGAWAGVAIAALAVGAIGSIDALFALWLAADVAVVAAGWLVIMRVARALPAPRTPAGAPASHGLSGVWLDGLPFFVALLLMSVLQYLERFAAAGVLPAAELGRYVFVWSIANAIQTVAAATVVAVATPRLVRARDAAPGAFRRELVRSIGASFALTAAAAVAIAALHGPLFRLAHEPADTLQTAGLAILLMSFVLRALADVLWAAAVALRAGRRVAVAMAGLTLACLPVSIGFVRGLGALGAACAHLAASVAIAAALIWIVAPGLARTAGAETEAEPGAADAA
ncbi:polysaccharide biosynthesis protein [Burkholderia metallica]|uniref:polysaccharide biosynthesis protein n=1 Tax=Burkholderia metallica TaxID=488729 RepID=UPI001CF22230|nr:polysaccharide biosynthesis protein [Burkholderia metallica]MCA8022946.1 polysaccharide biosynthesis protein [Burkholderia metallica]